MTEHEPPPDDDAPRSSETVAVLEFTSPSGLPPALAHASGLNRVVSHASGIHPAVAPALPASTSPGIVTPRRLVLRALFLATLLASLTWGIFEVRQLLNEERHPPRPQKDSGKLTEIPSTPVPDDDSVDDLELDDASYPGLRALALLRTHVKRDSDLDGPAIELAKSGAIAAQAVTVVNLWATWCGPCKAEFAGFQSMFVNNHRELGWDSETRFVPILLDDAENARTAYRDWSNAMPPIHAALIDQKLDQGGVRGALEPVSPQLAVAPIPVTILFDCRRRIRWSKIGGLDKAAFTILAEEIEKLRAELGQDKCRPKRVRKSSQPLDVKPQTPTTSPCNNNGKCEPQLNEDCRLCPGDCRCKRGEQCNPRTPAVCKEVI